MTSSATTPPRPQFGFWRLLVTVVVVGIVAYFLGRSISSQWHVIREEPWDIRPGWLLLSAAISWLGVVWLMHLWRTLITMMSGRPLGFWKAYRISALANLGKYVPGKVWSVMGLIYLLREEGHPTPSAVAATMLHQAYTIVSGILFVSAVLGAAVWGKLPLVVVFSVLVVSLIVLYPPLFEFLMNRGLRLVRREPISVKISFARALILYAGYTVAWIIYGAGFWLMSEGLGITAGPFWPVVASYGGAYLVGFLALFAPGGLGVREGVLAVMLGSYLPAGLPAMVAVVSRLWMTGIELAGLVPLLVLRRGK